MSLQGRLCLHPGKAHNGGEECPGETREDMHPKRRDRIPPTPPPPPPPPLCPFVLPANEPSHSLLVMVLASRPIEQPDVSLSTLVTLALRPGPPPPPSPLPPPALPPPSASGGGFPAVSPGLGPPPRNTSGWLWIPSAGGGGQKGGDQKGVYGRRKGKRRRRQKNRISKYRHQSLLWENP